MNQSLHLVIPGNPPTINHVYRNIAINRRITTKEGQRWVREVQLLAKASIKRQGWILSEEEKLVAEVVIFWPTRRKRDVENVGKLL